MDYDLIVIGGGPGGYLAAQRAGNAGLRTLLLEKKQLGGVCLNEGCIPTKTLLHSARLLESCQTGGVFGVTCDHPSLNHQAVLARKEKIVKKLVAGVRSALKESRAEVVMAEGRLTDAAPQGVTVEAEGRSYSARHVILATGSAPAVPPIPGLEQAMASGHVMTSAQLLEISQVPPRLTVIGGGVIGLEMAAYFSAAGSAVTVIELTGKIGGQLEDELSGLLQKNLERRGITFLLNTRVVSVEGNVVTVQHQDGALTRLEPSAILLAAGRKAALPPIEGLKTDPMGITIDGQCRTSLPGVFAAGDCTGRSMLAHTAYRQAEVAVNTILGREDFMNYDAVPSVLYTHPEAAWVGLTHQQALSHGIDAVAVKLPMNYSGRYAAEHERGDGICKLVFDRNKQTLIGAHLLGGPASELIVCCGMLIETALPLERMKKLVFPHPTTGEIIREALFQADLS